MTREYKTRDALIEALKHGILAPSQAEAEALRLGLGPLKVEIDPGAFDVSRESRWTVAMTLAWLITADQRAVLEVWPLWRCNQRDWTRFDVLLLDSDKKRIASTVDGWILTASDRSPIQDLSFDYGQPDDPPPVTFAAAKAELWSRLIAGDLIAEAPHSGSWAELPPKVWKTIRIEHEAERDLFIAESAVQRSYDDDIYLRRADIVRLWPEGAAGCAKTESPEAPSRDTVERIREIARAAGDSWWAFPDVAQRDLFVQGEFAKAGDRNQGFPRASTIKAALHGTPFLRHRTRSDTKA